MIQTYMFSYRANGGQLRTMIESAHALGVGEHLHRAKPISSLGVWRCRPCRHDRYEGAPQVDLNAWHHTPRVGSH
jgi:hypothetical protein